MLLEIEHHSGRPIYRQVIEQIRRRIMAGQLAAGEQLVPVRDLAAQLRVNPMTISKAYSLLELEGLLERRRGVGLFVAKLRKDQKARAEVDLLDDVVSKAVTTAIQFGVPKAKLAEMLDKLYHKYDSKSRSNSND
ncbi:MAG: GntR family transcriptional regulator [Sedimentisphaerales bacterium]|nr:GntR family transcriptional regulator [Sedimentisphaerales bacterium]